MNLAIPTRQDLWARAEAFRQVRDQARRELARLAAARKRQQARQREARERAERAKRLRIAQGVPPLEASGLQRIELGRELKRLRRTLRPCSASVSSVGVETQLLRQSKVLLGRAKRLDSIRRRRINYRARVERRRKEAEARRTGIRLKVERVQAPVLTMARIRGIPAVASMARIRTAFAGGARAG